MDLLLLTLFVLSLAWVWGNALTMSRNGRRLLTPGVTVGDSMKPAIADGASFIVEHYPTSIEEGDVVVYEGEHTRICHRVIDTSGPFVRIKGDNNARDDGWFREDEIQAKVWAPFGKPLWIPLTPSAMQGWIEQKTKHLSG